MFFVVMVTVCFLGIPDTKWWGKKKSAFYSGDVVEEYAGGYLILPLNFINGIIHKQSQLGRTAG